ncbi:MAG: hypothetical protein JW893_00845 [Candidatus Omnitrophica bacterium]|nr:hypothetical protein [Candidatus Omnitrophota bacterium]
MKRNWVIHPFLFGIYPVFFLFAHNAHEAEVSEAALPFAVLLGFTCVMVLVSWILLRNFHKAGILTSVFMVLFFMYGHTRMYLDRFEVFHFGLRPLHDYLVWVGLLVILPVGLCFYTLLRVQKTPLGLTRFLNLVSIILMMMSLIQIGGFKLKLWGKHPDVRREQDSAVEAFTGHAIAPLRDIYYIILDGYGSAQTLKDIYGYSNEGFYEELEKRGFYVARESRSNYVYTTWSLPTSLNLNYMHYRDYEASSRTGPRFRPFYSTIKNNRVVRILKSMGYRYAHFASTAYPPTKASRDADFNFNNEKINEFATMLLKPSVLNPLMTVLTVPDRRQSVLYVFEKLKEMSKNPDPVFSFAHIILPHPPYVFKEDGGNYSFNQLINLGSQGGEYRKKLYAAQVAFANKKVIELVDYLLANSEIPPIIIFQGDHGPRLEWRMARTSAVNREDETELREYLKETLGILNIYYLPDGGDRNMYPSITPANSFRMIFNNYFGADYPLLDDESFVPSQDTSNSTPINVTETIAEVRRHEEGSYPF